MVSEMFFFLVLIFLILTYLIHAVLYSRKLQQSFPDVYAELGSPSVAGKKQNALPFILFFASGQYRQLHDQSFVRMGNRLIIHFIVTIMAFVAFLGYIISTGNLG